MRGWQIVVCVFVCEGYTIGQAARIAGVPPEQAYRLDGDLVYARALGFAMARSLGARGPV